MKNHFPILLVLLYPVLIYAADCKTILAKLADHSNDNTIFASQLRQVTQKCNNLPNAESDPQVVERCQTASFNSMVISGNYIAAEIQAVALCNAGQVDLSKNMMRSVVNNPHAPEEDKAIAQELLQN